jgi:hypothetical protein
MENKISRDISCHEGIFVYAHKIKQAQSSWREEKWERWYKLKDEKENSSAKKHLESSESAGKKSYSQSLRW